MRPCAAGSVNDVSEDVGLHTLTKPSFHFYATGEVRLLTFETWSIDMSVTLKKLCELGFFHTGKGDKTMCFHCCGGLMNWGKSDDPWVVHACWFLKCE